MQEPHLSKRLSKNLITIDGDTYSLSYKLETHTKLNDRTYEVSDFIVNT